MESGLYIVTLNNLDPISVNAHDKRLAEKSIKATKGNLKFGKAKILEGRKKNYDKTFGSENVNFFPLVEMLEIDLAEKMILRELIPYRVRGKSGRMTEWLQDISRGELIEIIFSVLDSHSLAYRDIRID